MKKEIIEKLKIGKTRKKGKNKKSRKIWMITGCFVVAAAGIVGLMAKNQSKEMSADGKAVRTATVEKRTITSELTSSSYLEAKATYSITSLVEGEVVTADFEEGDQVEMGQVLYQIDSSAMESQVESARNSVERAQENYEKAREKYEEAAGKYSQNTYKSTETGYLKTLYVKAGDKVSGNTKLADVYDDSVMKLRVPFLSQEAALIGVGNTGIVTLSDTLEQLECTVTSVSSMDETLSGGRIVRYVTVEVNNPGGLTSDYSAAVQIGDWLCAEEAAFQPSVEVVMSADVSSELEIETMLVSEGAYVSEGTPLFQMTAESASELLDTYKDSMDTAEENLEKAENSMDDTQDSYDNYTITAPIAGQVIEKTAKAGDTVTKGTSGSGTLATIYDLSSLVFNMNIDELDIQNVEVGQKVEITADAMEGQTFTGTVTNVSLVSNYSNGVTNYPVTVTLDDAGSLLPGMNVDGTIILDEAADVLSIPADALMRGNQVYIKDDSVTEADGAVPAGFRAVEVETGLISDEYVEIVSGLSEGDEVYTSSSSASNSSMMNNMMMPGGQMQGGPGGGAGNMGGSGRPGGPGGR